MTTTHVRLHYADNLGDGYGPEPIERTMWHEQDMEHGDAVTDDALLVYLWRYFNRVDGSNAESPAMDEKKQRSMCVGDVIELRGENGPRFYKCASFGWDPIEGCRSKVTT